MLTPRRKFLLVLALAHACWPLAHHLVLARHFLIDPWRFGGYAMFATILGENRVMLRVAGQEQDLSAQPREVRKALADLRLECGCWGRLADVDAARQALAATAAHRSVEIECSRTYLDAETGRIAARNWSFHF